MGNERFLIHELAERAQTTIRTIRYYTDEGLLPKPETQGKYAYYTNRHLERLELIRKLKNAYLPLREIRAQLEKITDDLVDSPIPDEGEKESLVTGPVDEEDTRHSGESAQAYIARLLEPRSEYPASPSPGRAPEQNILPSEPNRGLAQQSSSKIRVEKFSFNSESWRRIRIATGIELNFSDNLDEETKGKIQKFIRFAHDIFGENK